MATMNISLPDEMKAWVEEQVRSGRYSGASDVMRDLVRRGQEREAERERAITELQTLVDRRLAEPARPLDLDAFIAARTTDTVA